MRGGRVLLEVVGNMATLPSLDRFQDVPEVRPLPSTGVTRLPRYYEPVRRPTRPDRALAGLRLTPHRHRGGFPCCLFSLCGPAVASTPAGSSGLPALRTARGVQPLWSEGWQPSSHASRVGSRISVFEASMAFTVVTADSLAEPLRRPFASEASVASLPPRLLRLLPAGAQVAGWELHPLRKQTFARRTGTP